MVRILHEQNVGHQQNYYATGAVCKSCARARLKVLGWVLKGESFTDRRRDCQLSCIILERPQGSRVRFRRINTLGMRFLTINDLRSSNYSAFTFLSRIPLYCLPDIKRRVIITHARRTEESAKRVHAINHR